MVHGADDDPAAALTRLATGFRAARAVQVAARLGLADALRRGPRSPAGLAAATGTHPDALRRLLRALAGLGLLASDAKGRYRLTPVGDLLRGDVPGSLRDAVARLGEPEYWRAWGALDHSIATGRPAFEAVFGARLFDHLARHPEAAARFDRGMDADSARAAAPLVSALGHLGGIGTVVDVGGGHGALLAALLRAHPEVRGVLFEQPRATEAARAALAAAGLAGRCRVEAGDFFRAVPAGGDLYLLQRIVHDWDDADATRLLRNVRAAMPARARLLVIEAVVPPGDAPSHAKLLDLNMLVLVGGRERTEGEYRALLAAAGLTLRRVLAATAATSVIEAVPSDAASGATGDTRRRRWRREGVARAGRRSVVVLAGPRPRGTASHRPCARGPCTALPAPRARGQSVPAPARRRRRWLATRASSAVGDEVLGHAAQGTVAQDARALHCR